MIISFRFNNFRSFFDETMLDMQAVAYKEHSSHLIPVNHKKLIKTLAIYGANSSGKTNLLLALVDFHAYIYKQLFTMKVIEADPLLSVMQILPQGQIMPFWTLNEEPLPTSMELCFISQGHVFEYGFSIHDQTILSEYLSMDNHTVFTRAGEKIQPGRIYEKAFRSKSILPIRSNCLFCTILSCIDTPRLTEVMQPFNAYFSTGIHYDFEFANNLKLMEQTRSAFKNPALTDNPDALAYGLEHLKKMGFSLADIVPGTIFPKTSYRIRSHSTGQEGIYYAPLGSSSNGTLRCLSLLVQISHLIDSGGTLIVDDLSNGFHPNVTKYIVDLFQKEANQNSQLIFTTHDVSILNNRQFRRDEVAFVDLNEYNESRLYTLADIKVRSDASFSKDYLLGKYGAIPLVQQDI